MFSNQLKSAILQAAIQGKLTDQLPSDGDTRELINEIERERNQLLKKGKLSKFTKLQHINKADIHLELPKSWASAKLKYIADIRNGFTPNKSTPDFWNSNDIPWFTIEDIRNQGRFISQTSKFISNKALVNKNRIIPKNSILVCCTASIGECAYNTIDLVTNQQFNSISVKYSLTKYIYPIYIYYWAQTIKNQLIELSGKTTFSFLSVEKLSNIELPLPPISEQKRIVKKIEELLAKIEELENYESKLNDLVTKFPDQLKAAILQAAIQGKLTDQLPSDGHASDLIKEIEKERNQLVKQGKIKDSNKKVEPLNEDKIPFEIPKNWIFVKHNSIVRLSGGSQPSKQHFSYEPKKGYIRLFQIRDYGDSPIPVYIPVDKASKISNKGDILIARYGGSIGKIFIAENGAYNVAMAKAIHSSDILFSKFLYYFYLSPYFQEYLSSFSRSAQAGFNVENFNTFLIPLPPLNEQKRIVNKIEEILLKVELLN